MDVAAIDDLNRRFGLPGDGAAPEVAFRATPDGPIVIEVRNRLAAASVCLQGGQVLRWHPVGQPEPVLWLSTGARFERGRAIRGGVPVCWPWFGPHPTEPAWPSHGFARIARWAPTAALRLEDGATRIELVLDDDAAGRAFLDPAHYRLELAATVGATLRIELATSNRGAGPLPISEALHSYFRVSDIGGIEVRGLDQAAYVDQVDGGRRKLQADPIRFEREVDRVFVGSVAACEIDDPGLRRRLRITKSGSRSTVVWSPWQQKAERLGDLGQGRDGGAGWREMVCVESGNALDDRLTVAPGAEHRLQMQVDVEPSR